MIFCWHLFCFYLLVLSHWMDRYMPHLWRLAGCEGSLKASKSAKLRECGEFKSPNRTHHIPWYIGLLPAPFIYKLSVGFCWCDVVSVVYWEGLRGKSSASCSNDQQWASEPWFMRVLACLVAGLRVLAVKFTVTKLWKLKHCPRNPLCSYVFFNFRLAQHYSWWET